MDNRGFELRKLTDEDLSPKASYYQNEADGYAGMIMAQTYGMLFVDGADEKPIYYFRNMEVDKFRWAGIVELGDGPLEPQKSLHHQDIAQNGTAVTAYRRIADSPVTYEIASNEPYTQFRYFDGGMTWKEGVDGSILNIKAQPFPYALTTHFNSPQCSLTMYQNVYLSGTYEGKPVKGLGCFDRNYSPQGKLQHILKTAFSYVSSIYTGIREDGRTEAFYASYHASTDQWAGYYYIEGEDPIVTSDVKMEAKWRHLPYLCGDPTVVYTDCTWRIPGKEIHFHGKWGTKGFTATPRVEKLGQSHCMGVWYEGKTPYKHKLFHTFNENMDAIDYKMKQLGFDVED